MTTALTGASGRVRTIAIHLPQFHPIPENDAWWGQGFTEWTNVAKARALFRGHRQPRVPADLGYVDLRLHEARQAQADLARRHGIDGFCFYHYWFEGKRLIERPVDEILASGQPDFPFMLCWANETWSRRWLGEERDILLRQTYSMPDHERHAAWLSRAFADRRYVRVHDRPLFLIYRPLDIPELPAALDVYRRVVRAEVGREPFLVAVYSRRSGHDFRSEGFDYTMNFRPQLGVIPGVTDDGFGWRRWWRNWRLGISSGRLKAIDCAEFERRMRAIEPRHAHYFPSVFVGWDNTPRRGDRGVVVLGQSPARFHAQVRRAMDIASGRPLEEQLLFVNAWNEWAEGNHLEPDLTNGRAYLEALQAALENRPMRAAD
jgi:hypothetical protein